MCTTLLHCVCRQSAWQWRSVERRQWWEPVERRQRRPVERREWRPVERRERQTVERRERRPMGQQPMEQPLEQPVHVCGWMHRAPVPLRHCQCWHMLTPGRYGMQQCIRRRARQFEGLLSGMKHATVAAAGDQATTSSAARALLGRSRGYCQQYSVEAF